MSEQLTIFLAPQLEQKEFPEHCKHLEFTGPAGQVHVGFEVNSQFVLYAMKQNGINKVLASGFLTAGAAIRYAQQFGWSVLLSS